MSLCLVVASLMTVVMAHAVLDQEQVRLTQVQTELQAAQARHAADQLKVAQMETPSRITSAAQKDHLVTPTGVTQVPSVPLSKPLAPPKVTPAPSTTTTPAGG